MTNKKLPCGITLLEAELREVNHTTFDYDWIVNRNFQKLRERWETPTVPLQKWHYISPRMLMHVIRLLMRQIYSR